MVLFVARLMFSVEYECFKGDITFKKVETVFWFLSKLDDGRG